MARNENRYDALIEGIFFDHWKKGLAEFLFERHEIRSKADQLGLELPDNLGDVIYAFRFRRVLPESICRTQPKGKVWTIELAGRSRYRFKLFKETRIVPNPNLAVISIPDATPEVIRKYALDDEQALLAIVRYNRLVDIFLGLTTFSLQNHLRTTVEDIGQIEIDELYIGLDKRGCHYVIPMQAKGGDDQIGIVQTTQDVRFAAQKFPNVRCRALAAQFMANNVVALFELTLVDDEVRIVDERHYKLVGADQLNVAAILNYES